jgi:hypothetical protein
VRRRPALGFLFLVLALGFGAIAIGSGWGAGSSAGRWIVTAAAAFIAAWLALLAWRTMAPR